MKNYYQKLTTLYDLEGYRIAGVILFNLLGYNVCKNAGTANILHSPPNVNHPYEILMNALPRIDASLVLSVGAVASPIARHQNNRWSYNGRDFVTLSVNETPIAHYVNILKNTFGENYQMASKLSNYRASANTIKNFVGQIVTFAAIEHIPNKFDPTKPQVKAVIVDSAGTRQNVYCTPNIGNILSQVEDNNEFPLVARIVTFATNNAKNPTGYGLDDKGIAPAEVRKLEQRAIKALNAEDDTEELDPKSGKWKTVKKGSAKVDAKAPKQKAKKSA